jgi:PAS domain S-box-containing protein
MADRKSAQIFDSKGEREAWLEKIQFLSDALEATSQPFCAAGPDGSILIFNEAFCRLTGYTREELHDIDWAADLTLPESRENESRILDVLDQTRQPQRYEKCYRRKDGTVVPVELLVDLASDSKGRPLFYYAFITDITERKRAEEWRPPAPRCGKAR